MQNISSILKLNINILFTYSNEKGQPFSLFLISQKFNYFDVFIEHNDQIENISFNKFNNFVKFLSLRQSFAFRINIFKVVIL